jgi:2-dehydropantoate 2-reductase
MKVAVMGAGAVGCYYGAMLARAGHEVVLIGRPSHVEAVRAHGLRLETKAFDEQVRLDASTEPGAVRGAQLVLFCVKSADTEAAAAQIGPHLSPDALVLTLQNGVDNDERVRSVLPSSEVAAAVVYVATEMAGPGHVRHHGRGELVIAPSRMSEQVARELIAAGVPTQISGNVRGSLWAKLVLNCAYNALSAVAQLPYGELVKGVGVAKADGVEIPGDTDAAIRGIAQSMPSQYSSTAQDLARGKPSEIDHLNGFVVRRGEALGVPTPANRVLFVMVKLLEGKQR